MILPEIQYAVKTPTWQGPGAARILRPQRLTANFVTHLGLQVCWPESLAGFGLTRTRDLAPDEPDARLCVW